VYNKSRYSENPEKHISYTRNYYKENKESIIGKKIEYNKKYMKERIKIPIIRLKVNLRSRTGIAFKRMGYAKSTKTQELLGTEWEVCKEHIEKQFTKGMDWDNYGDWHIDHIIPLASAKTENRLVDLCHYLNLQPLWAEDNFKKGSKVIIIEI
tara:strand:+ start:309 stop:767 length:459 start_codon:yes stop_codon:yes gene_type:complete